jgi:hypothetical protein
LIPGNSPSAFAGGIFYVERRNNVSEKTAKGVTPEPEVLETPEAVTPEPEEKFDEAGYKALVAKLREAEKKGKADAKRLADMEKTEQERIDAEKSELQKAQDRADKAEAEAKKIRLDLQRREVAEKAKLPLSLADRLKGETPEEMEADAAILLAALPVKPAPKLEPTNPGEPQTGETDEQKRKRLGLSR